MFQTTKNFKFHTDYKYNSRQDKPKYVWYKYNQIIKGKILDVGADQCGLKRLFKNGQRYIGIGLGSSVDQEVDLEKGIIPFEDNTFDCVLCLDVLEHLDKMHKIFDELCRVTRKHLIISLPNPWADFIRMLRKGYYKHPDTPMKFNNLPVHPPEDRHKWFYGIHEAENFIKARGKLNGMELIQIDYTGQNSLLVKVKNRVFEIICKILCHRDLNIKSLYRGTLWTVLEKKC